jgi:hypothetical protein
MNYTITQDIVTPESVEFGEVDSTDAWDEDNLRYALESVRDTRTNGVGGVESTCAEYCGGQLCIAVYNGMEYRTGDYETRRLFIRNITRSSARRVCTLAGVQLRGA